mmetsp:Transcript_46022/g.85859  ORF Transcript_46022/g.85859 Transcript_46022/m.85859 type:complete len:321 (+) Transcript_46022:53-1015(+)
MADTDSEDPEEEETEEPEFVPPPPSKVVRQQRQSVSAEAFGEWNQRVVFEPLVYPKTPDQTQELVEVTSRSFLFTSLEVKDLQVVIAAMKGPLIIEPGTRIIQEGDTGDHLYVVTDGAMDCIKVIDGVEMVVKTCVKGDLFGELALLYNCPRAASVQCSEQQSVLWELDRATFNNIVMEGVQRKRNQCLSVLSSVPLFASITRGELENIIDALKMERRPRGDVIINQGEVGDHFYIVYEGQVMASKVSEESPDPVMMIHEAGDYFGELALILDEPRAATVVASSDPEVCLLSMDRATFKRITGEHSALHGFLESNVDRYA